jgi:Bacterial transcriptional activator domain
LMRLHYLAGDRASALRQYEHCVAILDEDFGIKPSKPTTALYEDILADQLEELHRQGTSGTTPEGPYLTLYEIFDSLTQLQVFLTDLQHQVQQHIQQVAPLLRESQEMHDSSTKDASRDIQQMPKETLPRAYHSRVQ